VKINLIKRKILLSDNFSSFLKKLYSVDMTLDNNRAVQAFIKQYQEIYYADLQTYKKYVGKEEHKQDLDKFLEEEIEILTIPRSTDIIKKGSSIFSPADLDCWDLIE
jgi:hypothetical protein